MCKEPTPEELETYRQEREAFMDLSKKSMPHIIARYFWSCFDIQRLSALWVQTINKTKGAETFPIPAPYLFNTLSFLLPPFSFLLPRSKLLRRSSPRSKHSPLGLAPKYSRPRLYFGAWPQRARANSNAQELTRFNEISCGKSCVIHIFFVPL